MIALLALLAPASAQVPAGELISPAVDVDITEDGFNAVEAVVPSFVPGSFAIPQVESMSGSCPWYLPTRTGIRVTGAEVFIDVPPSGVDIAPVPPGGYCGSGAQLDLSMQANIWVNSASDPFDLWIEVLCIGDTCNSYVDPFTAYVDATVCVDLVADPYTGALTLDARIDENSLSVVLDGPGGLTGDDIHLDNCAVGSLLSGLNLTDLLVGILVGQVDSMLSSEISGINDSIADALAGVGDSLVVQQSLDLGDGATVDLYLAPTEIWTDNTGLRLGLEGSAEARQVAECVAPYDPGSSLETPSNPPMLGELPGILQEPYHVSATIADEFVNQVFYAVWQSGILCQELGGDGAAPIDLPLPVDSTLLTLLAGDVYDEQFPEPAPILIRTRPEKPPILNNQPDDIDVEIEDLGLEIYFDKDGRKAKLVDLSLGLDAGLATSFDPTTGVVGVDIDLDGALSARVNDNEFAPGTDDEVAAGVEGLLQNPAIAGLVNDALAGLAGIGLPPVVFPDSDGDGLPEKFGVTDLVLTTAGSGDDWLGAYVWVGPVQYDYAGCDGGCGGCGGTTSSGCGSSSGCGAGSSGCAMGSTGCGTGTTGGGTNPTGGCNMDTGGCSTTGCNLAGGGGGRALAVTFAVLLVLRRRREP